MNFNPPSSYLHDRLIRLNGHIDRVTTFARGDGVRAAIQKTLPWPPLTHVAAAPRGGDGVATMATALRRHLHQGTTRTAQDLLGVAREEFSKAHPAPILDRVVAYVRSGRR